MEGNPIMITERKAIEEMLEDLRSEKRTLKANYRDDISQIEARQERLLERLERLDKIDRADIDAESTINVLSSITNKLSDLIPDIPAQLLLEKTAEKMAAASLVEEERPEILIEEKKEESQPVINLEEAPGIKPKPYSKKEILYVVSDFLQDKYLGIREIEDHLKNQYGWEWATFPASFSGWRNKYPNIINKEGLKYTSAIHNSEKKDDKKDDKKKMTLEEYALSI